MTLRSLIHPLVFVHARELRVRRVVTPKRVPAAVGSAIFRALKSRSCKGVFDAVALPFRKVHQPPRSQVLELRVGRLAHQAKLGWIVEENRWGASTAVQRWHQPDLFAPPA